MMFIKITPEKLVEALKAQGLTEVKAKVCAYDLMVASAVTKGEVWDAEASTDREPEESPPEDTPAVESKPLLVGRKSSKRINFKAFGGEAEPMTPGSGVVSPAPGYSASNFNEADEDDI